MSNSSIYETFADRLDYDFRSLARPNQLPPEGNWAIWLLLGACLLNPRRDGI
jgi:hypothetical protein